MFARFRTFRSRRRRAHAACLILSALRAEGIPDCADYPSPEQLPLLIKRMSAIRRVDMEPRDHALIEWNEVMMTAEFYSLGDTMSRWLLPELRSALGENAPGESESPAVRARRNRLRELIQAKASLIPEYTLPAWADRAADMEGIEREMIENARYLAADEPVAFALLFRRWLDGREPGAGNDPDYEQFDGVSKAILALTFFETEARKRIIARASRTELHALIKGLEKFPDADALVKEWVLVEFTREVLEQRCLPDEAAQEMASTLENYLSGGAEHDFETDPVSLQEGGAVDLEVTLSGGERARRELLERLSRMADGGEQEILAVLMRMK